MTTTFAMGIILKATHLLTINLKNLLTFFCQSYNFYKSCKEPSKLKQIIIYSSV